MTYFNDGQGQAPDPGYVVRNNTLVQANFRRRRARASAGIYDQISRPDEKATSNYGSLEAEYEVSDALDISGQIGTSKGHGETPTQDVSETVPGRGTGGELAAQWPRQRAGLQLRHRRHIDAVPGRHAGRLRLDLRRPDVDVEDEENWAKIDADFAVDSGAWTGLQFGVRYQEARARVAQRRSARARWRPAMDPANYPTSSRTIRPTSTPSAGSFPTNFWFWSPSQLADYNSPDIVNRDPVAR